MKHVSRLWGALLLVSLVMAGCASTASAFTEAEVPPGKAIVYLYRPKAFSLSGRTIFMALPGDDASYAMTNGGYFPLVVSPGPVTVAGVGTDMRAVKFSLDVELGKAYYVKVFFDESRLSLLVPAKFEIVDPSLGSAEVRKCSMISKSKGRKE